MNLFNPALRKEFGANWKLAYPIVVGQLGQIAVYVADNIMVGHLGAAELAGVSLAIAIFGMFFTVGFGMSFGLPPLVSEADGAGNLSRVKAFFNHSLIVNLSYAIIATASIFLITFILPYLKQDPGVIIHAKSYLYYMALSMVPFMLFQTLRTLCEGLSETKIPMIVILICNTLNIGLNYLLIYGKLGLPAMGVAGAGLATLIARVLMILLLLVILVRHAKYSTYIQLLSPREWELPLFKKLLQLGIPTSAQMFFEVSAFSAASILMGMISKEAQAAHQLSINLASVTFMVCTGLAMTAMIRVGNQLGARDWEKLRLVGWSCIIQVILFMSICAIIFIIGNQWLPRLYTSDTEVIKIAGWLLLYAAIFQIPDGVQVTALSALRGLQDVKVPAFLTIFCYWGLGIPVSYLLGIRLGMGVHGIWIGLISCLTVSALLMTIRFRRKSMGG